MQLIDFVQAGRYAALAEEDEAEAVPDPAVTAKAAMERLSDAAPSGHRGLRQGRAQRPTPRRPTPLAALRPWAPGAALRVFASCGRPASGLAVRPQPAGVRVPQGRARRGRQAAPAGPQWAYWHGTDLSWRQSDAQRTPVTGWSGLSSTAAPRTPSPRRTSSQARCSRRP